MNAQDLLKMAGTEPHKDEINTFSMAEIESRLSEYAKEGKFDAPFWGVISDSLKEDFEGRKLKVMVYNYPPRQPMTIIAWA